MADAIRARSKVYCERPLFAKILASDMIYAGMKSLELPSINDFTITFKIAGCDRLKYN